MATGGGDVLRKRLEIGIWMTSQAKEITYIVYEYFEDLQRRSKSKRAL